MEILDSKKFRVRAKGELFGGYLFYGEEEYLKRNSLSEARKSVFPDGPDSFNHIRLDAENFSIEALENAIMALPVFAEKKLIEIHSLNLSSMKDNGNGNRYACIFPVQEPEVHYLPGEQPAAQHRCPCV